MPSQQVTIRPAPIERVKRTNAVVLRRSEQSVGVSSRWDPYTMKVDRRRNCYACRGFRHMVRYCRNWEGRVAENKRLEYGGERIEGNMNNLNNLKGVENLESLD